MTTAGQPLVRVEFEYHQSHVENRAKARAIDPQSMARVVVIWTVSISWSPIPFAFTCA